MRRLIFRPTPNVTSAVNCCTRGLNYATDKQMADPTGYADSEIDKYASVPSMGYVLTGERVASYCHSAGLRGICIRRKREDHFLCLFACNSQEGLAKNPVRDRYSAV